MESILSSISVSSNEIAAICLLLLAATRIYMQLIHFRFEELPISRAIAKRLGQDYVIQFHKTGFYLSLGYFLLFAPVVFF
ncbi:MAG: hypothetical protein HN353_04375 [Bdellovibrionales bacterium]|nr:hypothetical protein [Bdellovibrionales bacterium]MBT3527479.1 hypothetical protein [Bdellovibrionales bacterium]